MPVNEGASIRLPVAPFTALLTPCYNTADLSRRINMVLDVALQIVQIIISVSLVAVIIVQARGSGLGSLFGGSDAGGITKTRRGLEKTLFQLTVVLAILFVVFAIVQLLIQ